MFIKSLIALFYLAPQQLMVNGLSMFGQRENRGDWGKTAVGRNPGLVEPFT